MPSVTHISYIVSASNEVASNHSGNFTVEGNVKTAAVVPLVKRTIEIPLAGGVKDRVATSPQTYRVFSTAVIEGVVPVTSTVPVEPSTMPSIDLMEALALSV